MTDNTVFSSSFGTLAPYSWLVPSTEAQMEVAWGSSAPISVILIFKEVERGTRENIKRKEEIGTEDDQLTV